MKPASVVVLLDEGEGERVVGPAEGGGGVNAVVAVHLAVFDAVAEGFDFVGRFEGVVEVVEEKRHAQPPGFGLRGGAVDIGGEAEEGLFESGEKGKMLAAGPGFEVNQVLHGRQRSVALRGCRIDGCDRARGRACPRPPCAPPIMSPFYGGRGQAPPLFNVPMPVQTFIAFDADDTLWPCQPHFDHVEAELLQLLAPYADHGGHQRATLRRAAGQHAAVRLRGQVVHAVDD